MQNVIIINGSPRAPKSNSKHYAEIFNRYYKGDSEIFNINKNNHNEICKKIGMYRNILFTFPLYADGIPVTLLNFLKSLEETSLQYKPIINVIINCGFLESEQNTVCINMIKLFCKQNGYIFGSVLSIGSGEAILGTPFKFLVFCKIRKLAKGIYKNKYYNLTITMPLSKKMFVKASTHYWIEYGKRHGINKEQMESMEIEK